ncbi:MAG TPA: beta-ketoacyl-[acyl-carrier-protein] synthase family protein [Vicinamibacterales bacterium]|nr:beta-ketoacyl-[acyl-carrier-protein] synthase family protein [Vicinamibacterales bacterium]
MLNRVAISGIGVVSPYGLGRERFWSGVSRGCSATRAISDFDASPFPCRVAAPVPEGLTIEDALPVDRANGNGNGRPDPRRYSRASLIAVLAASEAWADAGLRLNEPGAGVLVGSGAGGIDVAERQYFEFFNEGWKRVTPYAIPVSIVGMISSEISIALELHGISHVISTGCTSSTDAIGYAASLIRAGEADVILSGGADACVTPGMIFGFSKMRAVATKYNDTPSEASRPFDLERDGFVLGEGAWMVVLEREDRARARGATIYATIDGYGSTCDAYHRVQMDPDGEQIVRAMALAVERSGRALEEIGYVNYHGTSTVLNDAVESRCVRRLFGARADAVPGSSTKSMIGHPQGASGAAGIVTSALALSRGFLPATINQRSTDPACDMDFIPNHGRAASPAAALCNCLGFGSKNSAIILGMARS